MARPVVPPARAPRRHLRLGEILVARGVLDEDVLASALAEQAGCESVDPRAVLLDRAVLARIGKGTAERLGFLPLSVDEDGTVRVLVSDPTDRALVKAISVAMRGRIRLAVCPPAPLAELIRRAWSGEAAPADSASTGAGEAPPPAGPSPVATARGEAPVGKTPTPGPAADFAKTEPARPEAGEAPVAPAAPGSVGGWTPPPPPTISGQVLDLAAAPQALPDLVQSLGRQPDAEGWQRLVRALLGGAVHWTADTVRFEAGPSETSVSFRLDGSWRPLLRLPAAAGAGLVAALAALAGRSAETGAPALDGVVLSGKAGGDRSVLLAVGAHAAGPATRISVAVRDPGLRFDLDRLGLPEDLAKRLRQWTAARQGLVLIVGPPDSGRTTLLRALGSRLAAYRPLAMLLRDPVPAPETPWFERGRTDEQGASALATALDLEPRILLVDDCDGPRLAGAAFAAGLSDHLVVASVRGRDCADALQRLRDLGLDDSLLGEQLLGVVETRLPRLLCPACWTRGQRGPDLAERLGLVAETIPAQVPTAGAGCPRCHHTGYRGRIGLYSRVELAAGVPGGCSPEELQAEVRAARPGSPAESALALLVKGRTSLEELARVLAPAPGRPPAGKPAPEAAQPTAGAEVAPRTGPEPGAAPTESRAQAGPAGPLVSVASPSWDPAAPEETVAGQPAPSAPEEDDDEQPLDVDGSGSDDRHVVLAIDPRGRTAGILAAALPPGEFRVVVARTLADAIAQVRRDLPTAVMVASGWHLDTSGSIRAVRDDLSSAFLPLFVLSDDADHAVEYLRAGADEVLSTRTGTEELVLRIRAVIRRVT